MFFYKTDKLIIQCLNFRNEVKNKPFEFQNVKMLY